MADVATALTDAGLRERFGYDARVFA